MAARPKRSRMPSRPRMQVARMAKPTTTPALKKTRFLKKQKFVEVEIISRRAQGAKWKMPATVPALEEKVEAGGMVSSTWIAEIYWVASRKWAHMVLKNGYAYNVYVPFNMFQGWFYAHSKGTYFNYMIKDKFKVVRTA